MALASLLIAQLFIAKHYCPNIAFVRSDKLLSEYLGMKEAKDAFTQKQMLWQNNLDSLNHDIRKYRDTKGASKERIQQLEQNVAQYTEAINKLAQEEDMKSTDLVYQQINMFIEDYGKKKGYSMIFGSGNSGALLYGADAHDITARSWRA